MLDKVQIENNNIGFAKKPILGAREARILSYLGSCNALCRARLKDIIEACEHVNLQACSKEERKRLEIYYLRSLSALIRKRRVFKRKETEKVKLWLWDENPAVFPEWCSTVVKKATYYVLEE